VTAKAAQAAELFDPDDFRGPADVIHLPYEPAPEAPAPVDNRAGTKAPRRFGKRKLADAREQFIAVRCNAAEYETITTKAEKAGLSVGAYLRTIATGAAGPRAIRRQPVEREELARLLGELGKLGSNVNQIARVVNTTGDKRADHDLTAIAGDVQVMRSALMKALGRGD
jgi:hypothetical protein